MMKALLLLLLSGGRALASDRCPGNDIGKLDVRNFEVVASSEGSEPLKFRNGVALGKIDQDQKSPEWEYRIKKDEWIKPLPDLKLRVLTVNKNHLQGSGSNDLFTVLACEGGRLKVVWAATPVSSVKVNEGMISYETLGEYRGAQPPGPGSRFVLKWNQARKGFQKSPQ